MQNCIVVLAGGMGKRMKSDTPKVLHKLNEYSILSNIIIKLKRLNVDIFVVTGKFHNMIKNTIDLEVPEPSNIKYVKQEPAYGTGHALQCAFETIKKKYKGVLVLNGDCPFLNIESVKNMINCKQDCMLGICTMSKTDENWHGHGRIIIEDNKIKKIVEAKDCNDDEFKISTINGGVYYFNISILSNFIYKLDNNNKQKEFYITDLIHHFVSNNYSVFPMYLSKKEILNINTPEELEIAKKIY